MDIKPQAVTIPKSTDHLEKGKCGPVFPKTPACYAFTIIATVKAGRAEAIRGYGERLAKALHAARGPIHVLAKQPIDLSRPHPFVEAGSDEFNTLVWMPPGGARAGDVLVVDSTVFSTLFGSDEHQFRIA